VRHADNGQKLATTENEGEPVSENTLSTAIKAVDEHLQRADADAALRALDTLRQELVAFSDTARELTPIERSALQSADPTRVALTPKERAAFRYAMSALLDGVEGCLLLGDVEAARKILARLIAVGASS